MGDMGLISRFTSGVWGKYKLVVLRVHFMKVVAGEKSPHDGRSDEPAHGVANSFRVVSIDLRSIQRGKCFGIDDNVSSEPTPRHHCCVMMSIQNPSRPSDSKVVTSPPSDLWV